ncbi:MAG: folylpolyglutamate synthase/dihydrofolate synthase family protein [Candidatus Neomarinimicrobiota bacterium]
MHTLLKYLFNLERRGIKLGLDSTRELLKRCGNPHQGFPIVQIAGTNGKGSTAAMTAHILFKHGRRVGLYTSPHLCRFNERIRIDGITIADSYIIQWVKEHKRDLEEISATFFEATTTMALNYFYDRGVDVAILETGLGGRLDATTATDPDWTALTPIALDHSDMLGDSVEMIAREKAGIMKAGVPCFSAPQTPAVQQVIESEAEHVGTSVIFLDEDISIPQPHKLPGHHQHTNAILAWNLAQAILAHNFDPSIARKAIIAAFWPGRYQQLQERPKVIYDVAHNPHGAAAFLETMAGEPTTNRKWLVLAIQQGKKVDQMLEMLLPRFETVVLTQTDIRHFVPVHDLAHQVGTSFLNLEIEANPVAAIQRAVNEATEKDFVAILGSHYLGPAVAQVFKISFDILY